MNIKNLDFFQGRKGDAAVLAGGSLLPLAFAPFGLWPIAFISIALLFLAWLDNTPKQAFWRGWLFGIGMFGFGVSWVHISMHYFGGVSIPLSMFLTGLFVLFFALFPATVGYLARKMFPMLGNNHAIQLIISFPVLWVFFEWVRSWVLTGFPWLNLGYGQIDSPLSGYAPLWGIYGISLAVTVSAGLVITSWVDRAAWKKYIPLLVFIWLFPLGLKNIDWSEPTGEPITVSMIQGNIPQDQKWLPEQRKPQLELYYQLSQKNWGTSDLIIWPETAIPALHHQAESFLKGLAQEARMNSSELLIGIPVYDKQEDVYYNTMLTLGNDESFYQKQHLVPFGEYLPLPGLFQHFVDYFSIPMSNFSSGTSEKPILHVAGHKAGISICYEDVFGEEVIMALPEASFLINASNDAWFGDSIAPHQHLEIARMRSLETGRYMLRSTNTGVSAVIDPKGKIVAESPQFETHVLTHTIQPMRGASVYVVFGNIPIIFILFAMIFAGFVIEYNLKKKKNTA